MNKYYCSQLKFTAKEETFQYMFCYLVGKSDGCVLFKGKTAFGLHAFHYTRYNGTAAMGREIITGEVIERACAGFGEAKLIRVKGIAHCVNNTADALAGGVYGNGDFVSVFGMGGNGGYHTAYTGIDNYFGHVFCLLDKTIFMY